MKLRPWNDSGIWHEIAITQFDCGAADDNLSAPQVFGTRTAVENIRERDDGNVLEPDTKIEIERRSVFLERSRGQDGRCRGNEFAAYGISEGVAPDSAIRRRRDIDRGLPRVRPELWQASIDVQGKSVIDPVHSLLEEGQHHRSPGRTQRVRKSRIVGRRGARAQVNIEKNVCDTGFPQFLNEVRV